MPDPELVVVMPVDTPAKRWTEEHPSPTLAEITEGERLRQAIDTDDDTDNGLTGD
jgi:hypothetical protein